MREPTVLDYFKSLFDKKLKKQFDSRFFPEKPEIAKKNISETADSENGPKERGCLFFAVVLALIGQFLLEPPRNHNYVSIILYTGAIILFWLSLKSNTSGIYEPNLVNQAPLSNPNLKQIWLLPSLIFLALAFSFFSNNQFTFTNLFFWISGILLFIFAVWQSNEKAPQKKENLKYATLIFSAVVLISLFFRFYQINQVPGEMFSDHAEKLLDVMDILDGKTPIFFERNTGRESLQFYLTAAIIKFLGTGIIFTSLKIGTILLGLLSLPFIYLLGQQLSGKWAGILASLFAGIAYWPNVISRVGLRFPLYPLFTAATLYFLIKGLQEKRFNLLVLAGLSLGLGLHGYSPIRIVPVLVGVIFLLFIFHENSRANRIFALNGFFLLAFSSFIVFLPLFRYMLENPVVFNYRTLSRLTSLESPIDGSAVIIFMGNFWKSMIMFFYKNGVVWVNSIPNRPALDFISAVFFLYGVIILIRRYLISKAWQDLCLIISIPILMLPSIMSLAFPQENPALNRSGGAIVPVFIMVGVGFFNFVRVLVTNNRIPGQRIVYSLFIILLALISMQQNYDLVFSQYAEQFLANAWNTSEIGAVITHFVNEGNDPDNAFVVPYPHWVDTRLVGINAGYPRKDYALWAEDIRSTIDLNGEKIFILMPQDRKALDTIKLIYPQAEEEFYYSRVSGKNFIIASVK